MDLVKSPDVLIPACDDAQGSRQRSNRNLLRVINRELDGDLPVDAFAHRAVWSAAADRIEMYLVATTDVRAYLAAIELPLEFRSGEHLITEHSHKFQIAPLRRELASVGLHARS
jgi:L-histidine N-alpha-methyltransferase